MTARDATRALLALLLAAAPRPTAAAVWINDAIPARRTAPGVVFLDQTLHVVFSGGPVFLAAASDGTGSVNADDGLELTVTRPDGTTVTFAFDYSAGCTRITPAAPQEITQLFQAGPNDVRVQLKDRCGGFVGASSYWLVGVDAEPVWSAAWVGRPSTFSRARAAAQTVVVGRVVDVRPGPDIVVAVGEDAEGGDQETEERIPTQRITFAVAQTMRGSAAGTVTVFHTGSDTEWIDEDPPYRLGETHVLFLVAKEDEPGAYRVIAPEGRYRVDGERLVPAARQGFAPRLTGMSLPRFQRRVSR